MRCCHVAAGTFAAFALFIVLAALAAVANATPVEPSVWCASFPYLCRTGTMSLLMAKGTGEDKLYIVEIDPATGALVTSATASLPAGAATSAKQDTGNTSLASIDSKLSGTIAVSAASLPLPTGAATEVTLSSVSSSSSTTATNTGTVATNTTAINGKLYSNAGNTASKVDGSSFTQPVSGTVAATQSGTWNVSNVSGTVSLPTGASTESTLSTLNGKVADDFGAASGGVRSAAIIGNASGAADFGSGTAGAQTVRTVLATRHESSSTPVSVRISDGSTFVTPSTKGRTYADSARNAYASTSVTTGAWVQLIASTAANINALQIFDSCGQTLELGTGAAAAETRVMIIPPGGLDGQVSLYIPASTRVSVRAISGTCSTGELDITGLN
jgi:hypothetical protein